MIKSVGRRSLSLVELYRRAKIADATRRGDVAEHDSATSDAAPGFVDPREERGIRYPGDFPNDLTRFYRGCF